MNPPPNTLLLRLAGVMQSWGTSSRLQLRRTDVYPSKSGVLGLLLCAMGVRRGESRGKLEELSALRMGVRVDRGGTVDWDYHTAGAKIGIRQAGAKGPKRTAKTRELEPQLSRRQYLYDASFLVALLGEPQTIAECASYLDGTRGPVWPVFLGRKCCIPAEPVFVRTGNFHSLADALTSVPWRPRVKAIDSPDPPLILEKKLDVHVEHSPGSPPPDGGTLVYDVPRAFGFFDYGPRWVVHGQVTVPVGSPIHPRPPWEGPRADPYGPGWEEARRARLRMDNYLCVFCKSPAEQVHHVVYRDNRVEDLRSLCRTCHDACTMLEYGTGVAERVDPLDPAQRPAILRQIRRLIAERRSGRRRELLESGRVAARSFRQTPEPSTSEGG